MKIGLKIKHVLEKLPDDFPTKALSCFIKVTHFLGFVVSVLLIFVLALVIFTWGDFPLSKQIENIRENDLGRGDSIPFIFLQLIASCLNAMMFRYTYKLDLTREDKLFPGNRSTFCDAFGLLNCIGVSMLYISIVGVAYKMFSVLIAASILVFFLPVLTWTIWNAYEWIVKRLQKISENDPENLIHKETNTNSSSSSRTTLNLLDEKKMENNMAA